MPVVRIRLRGLDSRLGLLVTLVFAVSIHLPIYGNGLNPDATTYMDLTHSLMNSGTLERPTLSYPRHPPLMPLLYAPYAFLLGFGEFSAHTLELSFFAIDLVILYLMSLRRLGPWFALVPLLLLTFDPVLYLNMSEGRSLSVLILFALTTLWGIWRGLENSNWLWVAGVGASLGFLTADTVGYLFVAAGLVGVLWRFYYQRWRIFADRGFVLASTIFVGTVAAWTAYNLRAIGSPYTDPRVVGFLNRFLFSTPGFVVIILAGGLVAYFALYVSQTALPFLLSRDGRRTAMALPSRAVRDEKIGALVLFIFITILISAVMSAAFVLYDPLRSLGTADTYLRYAGLVAPMSYLAVGMYIRSASNRGPGRRWMAPLIIALLVLAPQFLGKVGQGQANSEVFTEISFTLRTRGFAMVYSDVAPFLRYNVPTAAFVEVDVGTSQQYVNLTTKQVPAGAALLTLLLVPRAYDERIGGFFLVGHFNASANSPFLNLVYGA